MAGYVWRERTRQARTPGFGRYCGTDRGIQLHNENDEALCDSCSTAWEQTSTTRRLSRNTCRNGHTLTVDNVHSLTGRCLECERARDMAVVRCLNCGTETLRTRFSNHKRLKHGNCQDASYAVAA